MSHHYSGPDFGFPRGDARLDFTDLYAFPKPGDAGKSILIMNVHPSAGENPPPHEWEGDGRQGRGTSRSGHRVSLRGATARGSVTRAPADC